jgi:hypothetical protein
MKKFFCLIFILFTFTACKDAKDALTLQKKPSSDEFLVEKKNPLVLPPNYGELPIPSEGDDKKKDNGNELKVTSGEINITMDEKIINSEPSALEKSLIKKMK